MKAALIVSSVLNLALAGGLIFILASPHPQVGIPALPAAATSQQKMPVFAAATPLLEQPKTKPFRWSQLESADYRMYVRNLRNSGCPEATVRAIVAADVDSVYRHDSAEMERKLADLANGSLADQLKSFDEQQTLKTRLQKMPAEENSEIAYLLGLSVPSAAAASTIPLSIQTGAEAATTSAPTMVATDAANWAMPTSADTEPAATSLPAHRKRNYWEGNPVAYPLVFQKVDLPALNLNADQVQAVQNLQQSFADQVGGANQDPSDPAYRQRWQQAQMNADNMLRDLLGWTGFQNYQIAAQANPQVTATGTP